MVIAALPLATLLVAWAIPDELYRLYWGTPAYVSAHIEVFLAEMACLAGGVLLAAPVRRSRLVTPPAAADLWRGPALRALFWVTIAGYVALSMAVIRGGASLADLIKAATEFNVLENDLKKNLVTIPGVTTMTQAGIAYCVVAGLALAQPLPRRERRRIHQGLALLLGLAVVRSFVLAERLAVLECLVPLMVARVALAPAKERIVRAVRPLPLIAAPLIFGFFSALEYSRSWAYYSQHSTLDFPQFAAIRFLGYYVTGHNNAALRLSFEQPPDVPKDLLSFFWSFVVRTDDHSFAILLFQHGNREFNNPGGLSAVLMDFGTLGGLVIAAALGLATGVCYRSFRQGRLLGCLFYPLVFLTLVEFPRYLWFFQGRATPAIVLLAALLLLAHQADRRRRAGSTE